MNNGYIELANAIVLQAANDYHKALKRIKKHPRNGSALYTKQEVERFFRFDWFALLTSIDPEWLINKIQEEVEL